MGDISEKYRKGSDILTEGVKQAYMGEMNPDVLKSTKKAGSRRGNRIRVQRWRPRKSVRELTTKIAVTYKSWFYIMVMTSNHCYFFFKV